MKKWLIIALCALCAMGISACKTDDDSSSKKSSSKPTNSSIGEVELPEDIFD